MAFSWQRICPGANLYQMRGVRARTTPSGFSGFSRLPELVNVLVAGFPEDTASKLRFQVKQGLLLVPLSFPKPDARIVK